MLQNITVHTKLGAGKMELINKTDFPPFPGTVGNVILSRILISPAPIGSNEPRDYVCAGYRMCSTKAICLMSDGFYPFP